VAPIGPLHHNASEIGLMNNFGWRGFGLWIDYDEFFYSVSGMEMLLLFLRICSDADRP
jgi:hypothetical protein